MLDKGPTFWAKILWQLCLCSLAVGCLDSWTPGTFGIIVRVVPTLLEGAVTQGAWLCVCFVHAVLWAGDPGAGCAGGYNVRSAVPKCRMWTPERYSLPKAFCPLSHWSPPNKSSKDPEFWTFWVYSLSQRLANHIKVSHFQIDKPCLIPQEGGTWSLLKPPWGVLLPKTLLQTTRELTTAVNLRWFLSFDFSFFHNCYFAAEIIYNYNKNTSGFLLKVGGENYYSAMIPFSFVDLSQ